MPPQTHQPLSESTLLARYLLLPSSLPTILPYNAFLSLLTTSARNNEDLRPHLRRLYADLQSQRNIDLETVRNNIARECARAGTVKAQLRRDLARELDDIDATSGNPGANDDAHIIDFKRDPSVELIPSRKRKRPAGADDDDNDDSDEDQATPSPAPSVELDAGASSSSSPQQEEIPESSNPAASDSSTSSSSMIHVTSPIAPSSEPPTAPGPAAVTTTTKTAHLDLLLDAAFHGPRGLALPSTTAAFPTTQQPHTKASLLAAMEAAVQALEREVAGLEGQAREVMGQMRETVGGLSDLRYGSFGGRGSGAAGGAAAGVGDGVEKEVEMGLRTLREVVGRKVREL